MQQPDVAKSDAAPKLGKEKSLVWVIVTIVAIGVIALLWGIIPISSYLAHPSRRQIVSLRADVRASNDTLYLTNQDNFDWTDVHVFLNGFDYEYDISSLAAGSTVALNLPDFATADGDMFNPSLQKLTVVYITSRDPKGTTSYGF